MTKLHRCVRMRTRQVISIVSLGLFAFAAGPVFAEEKSDVPISIYEMQPDVLLSEMDLSTNAVNILTSLLAHAEANIESIENERKPLSGQYRSVKKELAGKIRAAESTPSEEDIALQKRIHELEAELRQLREERKNRLMNREDIKALQQQYDELMGTHQRLTQDYKKWEELKRELKEMVLKKKDPGRYDNWKRSQKVRAAAGYMPKPIPEVK